MHCIVCVGSFLQLIGFSILLFMQRAHHIHSLRETETLKEQNEIEVLLVVVLFFLGFSYSLKISIQPQIVPFIVRDEIKIESASAYNMAMDHGFTSITLIMVGLMENVMTFQNSMYPIFVFLLVLSIASTVFFILLYYVDVYVKGGYLDSQHLYMHHKISNKLQILKYNTDHQQLGTPLNAQQNQNTHFNWFQQDQGPTMQSGALQLGQ